MDTLPSRSPTPLRAVTDSLEETLTLVEDAQTLLLVLRKDEVYEALAGLLDTAIRQLEEAMLVVAQEAARWERSMPPGGQFPEGGLGFPSPSGGHNSPIT